MLVLAGEGIFHLFIFRIFRGRGVCQQFTDTGTVLQLRLDQCGEDGGLEGFGDIGIGTDVQTFDLVVGCDLRRNQDYGDVAELDILLDLLTELITVLARHGAAARISSRAVSASRQVISR